MLEQLEDVASRLGLSLEDALTQKLDELLQRWHLLLRPSSRLRPPEVVEYLRQATGSDPSPQLIELVRETGRGPRLSDGDVMTLEQRQNFRCALCGVPLGVIAQPHVDHVVPVARGGNSELDNLQLLCRRCNLGKSDLVGWVLDVPYLREGLTDRMRYCVLARDRSTCQVTGCARKSPSTELRVVPRISEAQGGRLIFDNLHTMCAHHAGERDRQARQRTGNAAWQARMGMRP